MFHPDSPSPPVLEKTIMHLSDSFLLVLKLVQDKTDLHIFIMRIPNKL